jgi:hypothetical protein
MVPIRNISNDAQEGTDLVSRKLKDYLRALA